jgi:hypothetical protein
MSFFYTVPLEAVGGYSFDYPADISAKTGLFGLTLPAQELYEMLARDVEDADPKRAAFFREVASRYPTMDKSGHTVARDMRGQFLPDCDPWDDMTTDQQAFRGNCNATIALMERIRYELEMMEDDPSRKEQIDHIRRTVGDLLDDLLAVDL